MTDLNETSIKSLRLGSITRQRVLLLEYIITLYLLEPFVGDFLYSKCNINDYKISSIFCKKVLL